VSEPTPQPADSHAPARDDGVYVMSVAVQLTGVPAATLRLYEDRGLLTPARTGGRTRRYSPSDIARIHRIAELSAAGINLAGIGLILDLQDHASDLRIELHQANARNDEPRGQRDPEATRSPG
jgi:MerR family transcriptional regulator/heat shock protein HspR